MFETRSHAWRAAGLERELIQRRVSRALAQAALLLPLLIGIIVAYTHRHELFPGAGESVRIVTVIVLLVVGWAFARAVGRGLAPTLFRRLDPATAGTVGFLIRLTTLGVALLVALRIAGLQAGTLAIGGAVTAVVFGLAAQQTLGNLFAGTVLLSARPFRVGERVRLRGGPLAGQLDGTVSSLGLLYTSLATGEDRVMIPNSIVLQLAITPLREPNSVALRARFPADVLPSAVQDLLDNGITVPTRSRPDIELEEMDGDEVVVRISATPQTASDGAKLADEILAAIGRTAREGNGSSPAPSAPAPAASMRHDDL